MDMISAMDPVLALDPFETQVQRLYDSKQQDINLALADDRSLVHHHFGIGFVSDEELERLDQDQIDKRLHAMENRQVDLILEAMSGLGPHDRVFDGGSGRGGTALLLHEATGCHYDGVNISDYQLAFARDLVRRRAHEDHISFHKANMRSTPFDGARFDWALTNETTMYVLDLRYLFAEFARILKPGGRYVCITWAVNGALPDPSPFISPIDRHYLCSMHTDEAYLSALLASGLVPLHVEDHSPAAVDYWRVRDRSHRRTGVERLFLDGYAAGAVKYLRIVAERRDTHAS